MLFFVEMDGLANDESLCQAFSALRPACVKLAQEASLDNLRSLGRAIAGAEKEALCELQEYVFFVLKLAFNRITSMLVFC